MNNQYESYLRNIMAKSRRSDSRPLDKFTNLLTEANTRGYSQMRNCELHPLGGIGSNQWAVTLHKNTIARITNLEDGRSVVVVDSVDEFPTMTTAARLEPILGVGIGKKDNRLLVGGHNLKERGNPQPMCNGTAFVRDERGRAYVLNPEKMTRTKEVVNSENTPPVLAYLKQLRQALVPMARIGAVAVADIAEFVDAENRGIEGRLTSMAAEPDAEVLGYLVHRGGSITHGFWKMRQLVQQNSEITPQAALLYLESGLRSLKNDLYKYRNCYKTVTETCEDAYYDYTTLTDRVPGY